jgi:DNA-binding IclR family transcriptional regulator
MAVRRSPQTERVVGLINLLTAGSRDGVTLTELAKRLHVSKPTLYPMLETLTEAGYVVRRPGRKTYHLGPALIAAGAAAAEHNGVLESARQAMIDLGEELDVTCWLFGVEDGYLRLLDQAWHSRHRIPYVRVGERFEIAAPRGAVVAAWSGRSTVDRWFRAGHTPDEARSEYLELLAGIRKSGYAVTLEETPPARMRAIMHELVDAITPAERDALRQRIRSGLAMGAGSLLVHPEPETSYFVRFVEAPILVEDGHVELVLGCTHLPELTGREIARIGERVRAHAARAAQLSG